MVKETSNLASGGVTGGPAATDRLGSWGEIALYLKCEIRTAQRWEEEGLPVHRLQLQKQGRVYAYKSELDEWVRKRDPRRDDKEDEDKEDKKRVLGPSWLKLLWQSVRSSTEAGLKVIKDRAVVVLLSAALVGGAYLAWLYLGPHQKMLAVLPFENLSIDPSQKWFAEGSLTR